MNCCVVDPGPCEKGMEATGGGGGREGERIVLWEGEVRDWRMGIQSSCLIQGV